MSETFEHRLKSKSVEELAEMLETGELAFLSPNTAAYYANGYEFTFYLSNGELHEKLKAVLRDIDLENLLREENNEDQ